MDPGERMPLVSVLTPSLNQARWLPDALRSVEAQTYPKIEHIIMDGLSSDGSLALLSEAGPGVVWRSESDSGQSAALNAAFATSRGSIVGWLNADDAYFHTSVVEEVVRRFQTDPSVDVVYGHAALVNAGGLILHYVWAPPFNRRLLRWFNFIVQPTVFLRRSTLGDRLVDEDFEGSMDRELWLRLSEGRRFMRIDDVLAVDRHHPTRKSYLQQDVLRWDEQRVVERYGIPPMSRRRLGSRFTKVAFRLRGAPLVFRRPPDLAFQGASDGRARTFARQVASRRVWMPVE